MLHHCHRHRHPKTQYWIPAQGLLLARLVLLEPTGKIMALIAVISGLRT